MSIVNTAARTVKYLKEVSCFFSIIQCKVWAYCKQGLEFEYYAQPECWILTKTNKETKERSNVVKLPKEKITEKMLYS